MATLNVDEARLLAVYRAIKDLDQPNIISVHDVGAAAAALAETFEMDNEQNDLTAKELTALIRGFVGGLGAAAGSPPPPSIDQLYFDPEEETQYQGGRTGGTAVGQGEDARYVTSSADYGNVEK